MAESFLFSIAQSLISKLSSQAYEEASRVLGFYDHLKNLKDTLSLVQVVLLDADQKQVHNQELREWLRQLKRVFYDAEIVLDEFECRTLQKQVLKAHGTTKDKVRHFFSTSNPLVFRYRMVQQIKHVSKRLDKVAADRQKFSLQIIDVDTRVVHRREMTHSHHLSDSNVIGREQDKEKIIEVLMQQSPNDDDITLSVIPIVGMGGMGKTTLAKFVFNDERIHECFPLKMWVCVSDDFDITQLIIKIINSANDSDFLPGAPDHQQKLNEMDVEQLLNLARNKLAGKKFLLVLDDVWNDNRVKWVELRNIIQVGAAGSKILVTTRSHSIASMMGTVPSHILEDLSLEYSWSLFIKWAFKEGEEENYPHLEKIGREIVKKCKGVPLAVRTLGSLLFLKFEAIEWEHVRDNEIWNLSQIKDDIFPAFKLSYDLMPSYLRQCFAFFSLYPKGHEFDSFEVTSLWGARGLLSSPEKNRSLEDVTYQYLYELQSRSFLQDFVNFGTHCKFKIHDLLHDLALFVANDECLLVNSHIQSIPENVRHLSFVENDFLGKSLTTKSVGVRTIIFPIAGVGVGANDEAFFAMVSRYKYLQILDLSYSSFETLPRFIGKLKHIRCLSLRHNLKIKRLPDSVCMLQNLQSLWLRGCKNIETLPKGLQNLISLRDFEMTTKQAVLTENKIANLSSLEHLNVEFCYNLESLFSGIEFTIFIRGLTFVHCTSLKSLPLDSKHFPALEFLSVIGCYKLELFTGHEDQNFNLKLKTIEFSELPQLQILPHWLQGSVNTLLSLTLQHCYNLEELPDWLPMLTCLRVLVIVDCPMLQSLPDGIHCLATLERLEIKDCPELCEKYKPQVGECWNQISHIKQIKIVYLEEELVEEEEFEEVESFNNYDRC